MHICWGKDALVIQDDVEKPRWRAKEHTAVTASELWSPVCR